MRLITIDDFIDLYAKLKQRGLSFIVSKFSFHKIRRTKSAFNQVDIDASNWWAIPKVKQRWNAMITSNEYIEYEEFVVKNFLNNNQRLKMLSIGSGICSHELKFAKYKNFEDILCLDISDKLLKKAKDTATQQNLNNITFKALDIYDFEFPENYYDIVFFHASLHHFKNIDHLIGTLVNRTLKKNGKLIINEFVGANRLQFPEHQLKAINTALKMLPKKFKKRYKSSFYKKRVYGSGLLRMIIADPSECVESKNILPVIHKYYKTIYEAPYGGNILMTLLKDLSQHFINLDLEKKALLDRLFEFEDNYIKNHASDFVFGIYQTTKKTDN
ncbi:class I SAM-dependent methyltransferase [Gelatiniphilus marinus]|uniref:Class I SAM-dependent methyltransferase n=1 Tax=Gelatiniphilus marinus TaxID=1759464 RepID=A0ABW5JM39_9FLAO